ncbi:hypothetical protein [Kribbia dieselivorans]|uniref:hypothetical protein n=1 Tax=Kribbia dieselivorans TaxID=331526 RepID=UPI000839806E|nr:hypothetical protein [Kribbia dieselivorans]
MDALKIILVLAHILAAALIIIAPALRGGAGSPLQAWSARIQLLLGLALTGLAEAGDAEVNHAKIGTKLVVMLAVIACAEIANSKAKKDVKTPLAWVAAVLAVVNVVIAYAW